MQIILILTFIMLLGCYLIWSNKIRKNNLYAIEKDKLLNFRFLPKENSKVALTQETQFFIESTIKKYSLDKKLPYFKNGLPFAYVYIFTDPIEPYTQIVTAHQIWKEVVFDKIATPFNLPRKSNKSFTPTVMLKIQIQCVIQYCRNWWGYEGYFLSLLIEQNTGLIWDARGGLIDIDTL